MVDSKNKAGTSDIKRLIAEHKELETRIIQFNKRPRLTPEEECEVLKLKKLKLRKKDTIEALKAQQTEGM
jgi:hypothetical protein